MFHCLQHTNYSNIKVIITVTNRSYIIVVMSKISKEKMYEFYWKKPNLLILKGLYI